MLKYYFGVILRQSAVADSMTERKTFLSKVVNLPQHTYLSVNGEKNIPVFDPRQGSEDKLSSVQYVKFNLSPEQVEAFNKSESIITLGFDHSEYSHEHQLSSEQKDILYQDMKT